MARRIVSTLLAGLLLGLGGCATTEEKNPDQVSSIPWNRPEKWEGQGPLGGMLQQGH